MAWWTRFRPRARARGLEFVVDAPRIGDCVHRSREAILIRRHRRKGIRPTIRQTACTSHSPGQTGLLWGGPCRLGTAQDRRSGDFTAAMGPQPLRQWRAALRRATSRTIQPVELPRTGPRVFDNLDDFTEGGLPSPDARGLVELFPRCPSERSAPRAGGLDALIFPPA